MLNRAECQIERDIVNLYDAFGIRRMQFWGGIPVVGTWFRGQARGLLADGGQRRGKSFFGIGADAEVGVGLGKEDAAVLGEDVGGGKGRAPGVVAVDEGNIDEDGAVVVAVVIGDGVGQAELRGEGAAGVGEDGERERVLADHEVALAAGLRADGGQQRAGFAEPRIELAPGLELGDAVRAPAAAEELEDERARGRAGRRSGPAGRRRR